MRGLLQMSDADSVKPAHLCVPFCLTQWQALGATAAGMGFFAALYGVAAYADKASTVPFVRFPPDAVLPCSPCERCSHAGLLLGRAGKVLVSQMGVRITQAPREYPYDDLKSEMGGEQRKL